MRVYRDYFCEMFCARPIISLYRRQLSYLSVALWLSPMYELLRGQLDGVRALKAALGLVAVSVLVSTVGCQTASSQIDLSDSGVSLPGRDVYTVEKVSYLDASGPELVIPAGDPPPKIRDINSIERLPLSLDDAVHIALQNNSVIRKAGGHVLVTPQAVRTPSDPFMLANDPNLGSEAALSAFDMQLESGAYWNGGGRSLGTGISTGTFGVFAQPTTMATLGLGKTLQTGTRLNFGAVGGNDDDLTTGFYAAFGGELRQPLLRGAGREFNRIAGPYARPGFYRGIRIAQIDEQKSALELELAVLELVRDVTFTYWELHFAYRNLDAKRAALDQARRTWENEKMRAAARVTSADSEALARQQYFLADANVQNAISGTGPGPTGVYNAEAKLRSILGLPATDGKLIFPTDRPMQAEFHFDWTESLSVAHDRRIELRKQQAEIKKRKLELAAARNLQRPRVDLVAKYRRLANDPRDGGELFSEALQGWRIGVELRRPLGNRRENAAVHAAELQLRREHALLEEQHLQIDSQLRIAFTELDRAYGVTQSLAVSREAAMIRLEAETERHTLGATHIERVLEAENRAAQAETAYLRSLVDYNLAFFQVQLARGTFLDTLGIGISEYATPEEMVYTQYRPFPFSGEPQETAPSVSTQLASQNALLDANDRESHDSAELRGVQGDSP